MWCSAVGCIATLILSLLVAPRATPAQPRGTIPRVAILVPTSQEHPTPCLLAFQQGLRDLGYAEGQTIRLDYRYGEGHADQLPALAAELVQLAPDVLWTFADAAAWAAKRRHHVHSHCRRCGCGAGGTGARGEPGPARWEPHRAGASRHRGVG